MGPSIFVAAISLPKKSQNLLDKANYYPVLHIHGPQFGSWIMLCSSYNQNYCDKNDGFLHITQH